VKSFANWSIRYKLLALLLLLGIMTFAATVTIAYLKNLRALKQNVMNQLTGIRRSKASENRGLLSDHPQPRFDSQ